MVLTVSSQPPDLRFAMDFPGACEDWAPVDPGAAVGPDCPAGGGLSSKGAAHAGGTALMTTIACA